MLHGPAKNWIHKPHFLVECANISKKDVFVNMAPTQRNTYLYSYQADLETYTLMIALESFFFLFFFLILGLLKKPISVTKESKRWRQTDSLSVNQSEIIKLPLGHKQWQRKREIYSK